MNNKHKADMRKLFILTCRHETRFGVDFYTSPQPSVEKAEARVKSIMKNCDYDPENPGKDESFEHEIEECIIDVNMLQKVENEEE